MSLISPPAACPPTSSAQARKRSFPAAGLLQKSCAIGAFIDDEDDEDDISIAEPAPKRRMLNGLKSPPTLAIQLEDTTLPCRAEQRLSGIGRPRAIGAFIDDDEDDGEDSGRTAFLEKSSDTAAMRKLARGFLDQESVAESASALLFSHFPDRKEIRTCSGKSMNIRSRKTTEAVSLGQLVAARSTTKDGRAKTCYYGIDIHQLINDAARDNLQEESRRLKEAETPIPSVEQPAKIKPRKTLMWTEKYRARRFFDLVGDDRTHREVLRWLKGWDPIVFPGSSKPKQAFTKRQGMKDEAEEKPHRKILLLTGPPGLGKTTLAHVCALQAGYEVMEINASDERSSNVVKGRIRTTVGTESVKTLSTTKRGGQVQKTARPVCVVVDEADGVVGGSGSGEAGFIKALIDLIQLDAKNSSEASNPTQGSRKKKKGDDFRLLRPLILICNDVYHPSLRPLRHSGFAEIVRVGKPPLEAVVTRMKSIFEKEGIACESDGVRKLCEATWRMSAGTESRFDACGAAEGDLRSILVVGEWVAAKLRLSAEDRPRLTRKWVEKNMLGNLSHGGGGARGVGRGGVREVVSRVFITGAGFPIPATTPFAPLSATPKAKDPTVPQTKLHASELVKKAGMDRLREMINTSGEVDRIIMEIFSIYPLQPFNDDTTLSKPNSAYEWLHFHDSCSSRVFSDQDWEIMPYLSQGVLACHHLFASPARHFSRSLDQKNGGDEDGETRDGKDLPFSGSRADYDAKEAEKSNRATILELQSSLNATLLRSFRSLEDIATDLLPCLVRMLNPDVKPIIVGGSGESRGIASVRKESEREMVKRAVDVMSSIGVKFERGRLEGDFGSRGTQWVYRMEP
jgi:chromosome transmission fidelity protein 18